MGVPFIVTKYAMWTDSKRGKSDVVIAIHFIRIAISRFKGKQQGKAFLYIGVSVHFVKSLKKGMYQLHCINFRLKQACTIDNKFCY